MDDWSSFLYTADQWFITYSIPPAFPSVKLFQIGHTVELYLKAAYTKQTGDIEKTIKLGHNIKKLWDQIKKIDPNFMPSYEIRENIFFSDFLHQHAEGFSKVDRDHYFHNFELYFIAKHLGDLKYLGTKLKTIETGYTYGFSHPNDYWIVFIKEIRNYLEYSSLDQLKWISATLEHSREFVHPYAIHYLEKLLPE